MKKRDCFGPSGLAMTKEKGLAMTGFRHYFVMLLAMFVIITITTGCGGTENYGAAISNRVITKVDDILRNPDAYKGKTVTIKGEILNECPTGCWFDIKDGKVVIYVNTELAQFAIPQKTGHKALVEGKFLVEGGKPKIIGTGVKVK